MKLKRHLYCFAIDRFLRSGAHYTSHVAAASTTDRVTYTITPTATQSFNVYARWVAQATNASNATYTIAPNTAGSTPLVVTVNQRQDGGTWNYLGTVNLNTANQMTVTLSGQGNGIVMADAVKIVPNTTSATQASAFNIYTDHLNTPREIRNHANQLRWTWYPEVSGAFGAGLPNENPNTPALGVFAYNLRFPGQLYDPTSQLSYNYYRDYSSRTGRYIESDPIGLEGGINTYGYVGGNPLSAVDPRGLAYYPEEDFRNGDVIIERGAKIDGWIADVPNAITAGCGDEPIPYAADIDFIKVKGKWYKIKGGTATVGGSSIYGGRSDVSGLLTYEAYKRGLKSRLADLKDGGMTEYDNHIKAYTKNLCECSAKNR